MRFADKDRHQLFLEPEGLSTPEWYVQGLSTSMPEDVQLDVYKRQPYAGADADTDPFPCADSHPYARPRHGRWGNAL